MRKAALLFLLGLTACSLGKRGTVMERRTQWELRTGTLAATVAKHDGRVASLAVRGHELLAAPGELRLQAGNDKPVALDASLQGFATAERDGSLVMNGRDPASGVAVRAEWIAGRDLECRLTLTGSKAPRLDASVELRLPCVKQVLQLLAPAGNDRVTVDFSTGLRYAYRGSGSSLVMPAGVLYHPEADWGLMACADFVLPTRGFELSIETNPPTLALRRVHLRLEPGKPVTVSIILFGHEGDWRPGLGYLVERFPDFFVVPDPRVPNLHGAFVCGGGAPDDETIADWHRQHVQTVEVHGTLPFYGQHLPIGDSWTAFADDQWNQLRQWPNPDKPALDAPWQVVHAYVQRKRPPNISVAKINDYIQRLHAKGIYAIMYFNPTEAWKLWAKDKFPDDRVHTSANNLFPVWYESHLMCPNPDSPWGKHLLNEFEKMIDLYPEADGFFMDQSTYDMLDYAHDDGWSIDGNRTGYRMGWAIGQLSMRLRKMAEARGKFMWWNGPYYSDIAYFAAGMMAEAGSEPDVRRIHYLTMGGRASCTLSRKDESTFQNCAAYGIYPTAMPTDALRRIAARYWPVFHHFKAKRWAFEPHALTLPDDMRGNLYHLPDGNALACMVSRNRSLDGEAFDLGKQLTVRLPDAADFQAAYFLSPDLLGTRRLALDRKGDSLTITVPRHRSVSAILLAKTGVHLSVEGPFGIVAGQAAEMTAVVDNWTAEPVAGTWTSPAWADESVSAKPGASVRRAFRVQAPAKRSGLRETVACRAELGGTGHGGDLEVYTDAPLSLELALPKAFHQGQPTTARVWVFNAAEARDVKASLTGTGIAPAEQTARVAARSGHPFDFAITPTRGGQVAIEARAAAGDDHALLKTHAEIYATTASPKAFAQIRSARLTLDIFGSDHGRYKNKPLFLNGVPLGILPRQADRWGPADMRLPRKAVQAIREHNEIRIENPRGDAFKIRNLQLELCMRNGVYLLSKLNATAYTSWTDWPHGEGTLFEGGQPLTGIGIHIPVDANSTEEYADSIGEVVSGELVFDLFGANGGPYAQKPVTFNGIALGNLPTADAEAWAERTIPLPPAALELLGYTNHVVIKNSRPRDAFKLRKLHVRLKVKGGDTVVSQIDPGAYTSVSWKYAEGTIGCPMEVEVRFPR